jgi:hypothetical protein
MNKIWYEITTINSLDEVDIIKTTSNLEEAENCQEALNKKGIKNKIFKWTIENNKSKLIGEL